MSGVIVRFLLVFCIFSPFFDYFLGKCYNLFVILSDDTKFNDRKYFFFCKICFSAFILIIVLLISSDTLLHQVMHLFKFINPKSLPIPCSFWSLAAPTFELFHFLFFHVHVPQPLYYFLFVFILTYSLLPHFNRYLGFSQSIFHFNISLSAQVTTICRKILPYGSLHPQRAHW